MQSVIRLDPRQKGFMPVDGYLENTTVMDLVLKGARYRMRSAFVASVDLQKAFDSIAHVALLQVQEAFGLLLAECLSPICTPSGILSSSSLMG